MADTATVNWSGVASYLNIDDDIARRITFKECRRPPGCLKKDPEGPICFQCARLLHEKRREPVINHEDIYRPAPQEPKRDADELRNYLKNKNQDVISSGWVYRERSSHRHTLSDDFARLLMKTIDRLEARIAQLEDELRRR